MAVNVLSNALLRGLNGTGRIRTWTKPFDYVSGADDAGLMNPVRLSHLTKVFPVTPLSKSPTLRPTRWCTSRPSYWGCWLLECRRILQWTTLETERSDTKTIDTH